MKRDEPDMSAVFRTGAINRRPSIRQEGQLVMVFPGWARWTYRLVLMIVALLALILPLAVVPNYVRAQAVVMRDAAKPIQAVSAGIAGSVVGFPGRRVRDGDLLFEIYPSSSEPGSTKVDPTVPSSTIVARYSGVVRSLNVKLGQSITAGETLGWLVTDDAAFSVLAIFPASQLSRLRIGQIMSVHLSAMSGTQDEVQIHEIGEEVLSASAARRVLGPDLADMVTGDEPVIIVKSHILAPAGASTQGSYVDGSRVTVVARTRQDRVLDFVLRRAR